MPLLPKEEDVLPEGLFDLDVGKHPWGIAHVRSRQEKVFARYLVRRQVAFYLPQVERRRARSGRNLVSFVPLFPGYVFFRLAEDRDLIWRSGVTASIIDVPDQETLDEELRQLRALQLAGASLRVLGTFSAGDCVRVSDGVFAGYQGRVERDRGHDRLIVRISLLQKAVEVEFDRERLIRVSSR